MANQTQLGILNYRTKRMDFEISTSIMTRSYFLIAVSVFVTWDRHILFCFISLNWFNGQLQIFPKFYSECIQFTYYLIWVQNLNSQSPN